MDFIIYRRWRLLVFGAMAFTTFAPKAAEIEAQTGRSFMDDHGTRVAFVEYVGDVQLIGDSNFTWSTDASLGWIDGRDVRRYQFSRYSTNDSVWLGAGGVRFHYGETGRWSQPFFLSFQGAIHTGHTQALSSSGEFVSTLGWQGRHFNIQLRHISNAGLHDPNRGETMLLFGVAFGR
jgi:Lipid A 3-O-deacylase (PagL)